ncbi:Retrovirus-related Pol polyprotein from transposon TNT 1-94 [Senna tora]|uniref:Retrovirus-related Pol polyprotein from transposon TNT 1-94 n=1 Tax=Senna tora TaxID=362788 RepID=A0A834X2F1_9FABA|nr:Retrovirus-related Pol polyprotein from transposon TNT 1-94 [Senna tora]
MAADDTVGSSVTSNVTATNGTSWIDATPVLITGHKLNGHNAVTARVFYPTSTHVAQSAPCASLQVKIADGTMAKVSAIGSIKISHTLTLMTVLYVPALACNLLSSKLTQENNCCATFRAHDCVF